MKLPLEGRWLVTESGNTAAAVLMPLTSVVEIKAANSHYTEIIDTGGDTWAIKHHSDENQLICGTIDARSCGFVITVFGKDGSGKPKIFGVIYSLDPGTGQDPGTWEAEEEDPEPEG